MIKKIKLSGDHHGNNILHDFAKKLFNSPYITEVINNLPFNSFTKSFIHSVYDNGQIDIYLTKYDEGYGMTIQTTGANIIETTAIALPLESFKKLTHKYSTHKSTLHTCASYIGYYYLPCN